MKVIRSILGAILVFLDRLFAPKAEVQRTPEQQNAVDQECRGLSIYQFETCPFCIKVRRGVKRLGLNIELRNVLENEKYKNELMAGGGEYQVPCLRIEENGQVRWMYESDDILAYLKQRFAGTM